MNTKTTISIITVSFNAVKTIEETILSVLNQTYHNIEYIIIDGGSTDGTIDIINKYQDRISYWVSEPDEGIYDAMNKGIAKANGELVGIINADDCYHLNTVEEIVKNYTSNEITIFYGNLYWEGLNKLYIPPKKIILHTLYIGMIIPHPTMFVPREIYKQNGFFHTEYKICSDYDITLRFLKKNIVFKYINTIFPLVKMGGDGISSKKESKKIIIEERFLIRKKNINLFVAILFYCKERIMFLIRGK